MALEIGIALPTEAGRIINALKLFGWSSCAFVQEIPKIEKSTFQALTNQCQIVQQERLKLDKKVSNVLIDELLGHGENYPQISRLHVNLSDHSEYTLFSAFAKNGKFYESFRLISVTVSNEKIWNSILGLSNPPVDIIRLDLNQARLPFPIRRSQLARIGELGIFIELNIEPLITCSELISTYLRNLTPLLRFMRSSSILLTCGAKTVNGIRSPDDMVSLALLLGLGSEEVCRKIVKENPLICLRRSILRKNNTPGTQITVL